MIDLQPVTVVESWACPRDTVLSHTGVVIVHPLELVALKHRNPYERLDAAMAAIVARAHTQLDRISEQLDTDRESTSNIFDVRQCRICRCTDNDCSDCIEATGQPCSWIAWDLCSRCQANT